MAGIYIHVPFCAQRCVYCDFYFTTTDKGYGAFVDALTSEIEAYGKKYAEAEPIETLYIGGGTPSVLPLSEVARMIDAVDNHFGLEGVQEVTVEMNPENAEPAYLRGLKELGVTRLSLGVQSFFEEDLRFMNRVHNAHQAEQAVKDVADVFNSFSVDLIFGLPPQPFEYWGANLEKGVRLGAPHFSTYSLTVEERTPLAKQVARGLVKPATDETMRERFLFTVDYLVRHGYDHYEVCSFAKTGHRSQHNQAYWTHRNYLGFGPSAHSFWRTTRSMGRRWSNIRSLKHYKSALELHELPVDEDDDLTHDMLADEYIFLGLRLMEEGLPIDLLEHDYGVDLLRDKRSALATLEENGLITVSPDHVLLTREGAVVADAVALELVGCRLRTGVD